MKSQRMSDKRCGGVVSGKLPRKTRQCQKKEQIGGNPGQRKTKRRRRKEHSLIAEHSDKKWRPSLLVGSTVECGALPVDCIGRPFI